MSTNKSYIDPYQEIIDTTTSKYIDSHQYMSFYQSTPNNPSAPKPQIISQVTLNDSQDESLDSKCAYFVVIPPFANHYGILLSYEGTLAACDRNHFANGIEKLSCIILYDPIYSLTPDMKNELAEILQPKSLETTKAADGDKSSSMADNAFITVPKSKDNKHRLIELTSFADECNLFAFKDCEITPVVKNKAMRKQPRVQTDVSGYTYLNLRVPRAPKDCKNMGVMIYNDCIYPAVWDSGVTYRYYRQFTPKFEQFLNN